MISRMALLALLLAGIFDPENVAQIRVSLGILKVKVFSPTRLREPHLAQLTTCPAPCFLHLCRLYRAPRPGSCTVMGCPLPQEFSHGVIHTYPSAHKKCHPHRWGVRGLRGSGAEIVVTPYALPACALFLSKFLKEYVLCPRTPRSERGAAGPASLIPRH